MTEERQMTPYQKSLIGHKDYLKKDLKYIQGLIPKSSEMTADQLIVAVLNSMRKVPKLAACKPESVAYAIKHCAVFAQLPDTATQHCHLIPYGEECTFQHGFRGLIDLLMRSGVSRGVLYGLVWKQDIEAGRFRLAKTVDKACGVDFYHQDDMGENLQRIDDPNSFDYAYALIFPKDVNGIPGVSLMSTAELNRIRSTSKAWGRDGEKSIWGKWRDRMSIKTCIKQAGKYMRLTPEVAKAFALDDAQEAGIDTKGIVLEDADFEVVEPDHGGSAGNGSQTNSDKVADRLKNASGRASAAQQGDLSDQ